MNQQPDRGWGFILQPETVAALRRAVTRILSHVDEHRAVSALELAWTSTATRTATVSISMLTEDAAREPREMGVLQAGDGAGHVSVTLGPHLAIIRMGDAKLSGRNLEEPLRGDLLIAVHLAGAAPPAADRGEVRHPGIRFCLAGRLLQLA